MMTKQAMIKQLEKNAGVFGTAFTLGVPTLIGASIGNKANKGLSFEDRVLVQMKAHGMKKKDAIKAVYLRDEDEASPDGKARKIDRLKGPVIGGAIGLLAGLAAKGKIRSAWGV